MVFSTQEFFLLTQELFHFTQEILPLLPKKLQTPYSRNLRVSNLITENSNEKGNDSETRLQDLNG